MKEIERLLLTSPFLHYGEKCEIDFLTHIKALSIHHYNQCAPYREIVDSLSLDLQQVQEIADIPFLPASLFKQLDLLSIDRSEVYKIMTSSGTSGQSVSKIFLDKQNAITQSKVLSSIISSLMGPKRLPMLIIDHPSVVKDRSFFSARGAGILGFSIFGKDHTYALTDRMELDLDAVNDFVSRNKGSKIFVFGFTFMIWQYVLRQLQSLGISLDIKDGILIHGGGWKRLVELNISNPEFKSSAQRHLGVSTVINYYGMVEQTGSLYVECHQGNMHPTKYSDIVIRDPFTLKPLPALVEGLIQVMSLLPSSYPGHSLLTEDMGLLIGNNDCPCGLPGKHFKVLGRAPKAEIRGCSDTHAATT